MPGLFSGGRPDYAAVTRDHPVRGSKPDNASIKPEVSGNKRERRAGKDHRALPEERSRHNADQRERPKVR